MRRLAGWCALLIAGCGGNAAAPPRRATPTPQPPVALAGCSGIHARWAVLRGAGVDAAVTGSGPAIVFGNESGNSACAWIPLAERLAAAGHRVAVFDYDATGASAERDCVAQMLSVARALRGSGRFALVGASLGGRVVIEAAARRPPGLAALVSLSGERFVQNYRDIIASARRVRAPALYAGAREDGFTDGARQQNQLHAAMRGRPNELVQIGGVDHGTALLQHPAIATRVTGFIARELD